MRLADLVLHELDLLQLDDLALGLHRDPFSPGGLVGDRREVGRDALAAEDPMDDEIRIATDRRREVRVVLRREAEVPERLGGVARLLHRPEEHRVDEALLGAARDVAEHVGERARGRASLASAESEAVPL